MHKIAEKRRRFGYRRVRIMPERKGMIMIEKWPDRINQEEGLSVRQRRGRKRAQGSRTPVFRCHCARTSAGPWISCPTSSGPARCS